MARWLNNRLYICAAFVLMFFGTSAQDDETMHEYKDYKPYDQFYKFHKRSKTIGAWQINALKEGALVVRLRTNKKLVDAFLAQGSKQQALEKMAETFVVNKNTMMAYINNFTFCKLYFIYSSSSDSLLNGVRSGIFLDTNLAINPAIEMKEKFYLIAERDYAYNSSIGFVTEDSAKIVKETGNPVREMGVVIKNKYGHQLKPPFPYYIKDKTFAQDNVPFFIIPGPQSLTFYWVPGEDLKERQKLKSQHPDAAAGADIKVKKQFMYKNLAHMADLLNENLSAYFQVSPKPDINKLGPLIKPYLY